MLFLCEHFPLQQYHPYSPYLQSVILTLGDSSLVDRSRGRGTGGGAQLQPSGSREMRGNSEFGYWNRPGADEQTSHGMELIRQRLCCADHELVYRGLSAQHSIAIKGIRYSLRCSRRRFVHVLYALPSSLAPGVN